tara:strand:+ start:526 stop:894 length:369 start_codon:yes stop_codon:yes gene_type:complete
MKAEVVMTKFIFLMMLSFAVSATDIQLTWDLPTEREDGSQIESIDRFNLYQTFNNGGATILEIGSTVSSYQIPNVETGNYTFQISTVEAGQEGALSDPISVNIQPVVKYKPIKMILSIELIE